MMHQVKYSRIEEFLRYIERQRAYIFLSRRCGYAFYVYLSYQSYLRGIDQIMPSELAIWTKLCTIQRRHSRHYENRTYSCISADGEM